MNDVKLKFEESNIKTFLVAFVLTMIITTIGRFFMGFKYYYLDIAFLSLFIIMIPLYIKLKKEKPVNLVGLLYVMYMFIIVIILDSTSMNSFNFKTDFLNFLASLTIFIPTIIGFLVVGIKIRLEKRKFVNSNKQ